MLLQYIRVYVFLPYKPETLTLLEEILQKFTSQFGGVSYTPSSKILDELMVFGMYDDGGNFVSDRIILLWVDIDQTRVMEIDRYFTDFKRTYEKRLSEKELWITSQSIMRVA